MATQKFYANQSAIVSSTNESYNDHVATEISLRNYSVLLGFDTAAAASAYNVITNVALGVYVVNQQGQYWFVTYAPLASSFDEESVTYKTKPQSYAAETYKPGTSLSGGQYAEISPAGSDRLAIEYIVRHGLMLSGNYTTIQTSRGANKPYIIVTTSAELASGALTNFAPSSGYIDLSVDNVFAFGFEQAADKPSLAPLAVSSFTLQLRKHGQTATTNINVSTWAGDTPNVTVPGGTISGSSIDWRVAAKTNAGQTLTSDWMTLDVEDSPPTAWPVSPKDVIVDATKDLIFAWGHTSPTGATQSKADLQKSVDGSTWTTLATVTGADKQWTCPAGTLTSSIKYWRVRTHTTSGLVGEWSAAAQIVVIAAPPAPPIQIKSTGPRPSISWQTSEQEAYQVELDGKLSGGTHYGTDKTWTSPAYLADGSHTVRVRVQNQYGMWSDWGAAALPVTNTPGASITLTVQASSVADLSWQTSGSYDFYLVYRNGKPIAKLTQTQYTDELSSGSTTYQVRGCYADSSNYGLSSAVTVTITTGQYVTLYGIASGKKVTLKHCGLKNQPVQNSINRDIQYIFMYGSTYPHAERSEFVTKKVGGTAVFLPGEDKAGFDALIGELVCLKTQSGEMVVGYLNETSDTSRVNPDKSVVNFSIQQIDYAEVIDIDS